MERRPETADTRFAWNREIALAYQHFGTGQHDLLYLPGVRSNVDVMWEEPAYARFLRRLASFTRLLVMDRRGYGCSERFSPGDVAPLEVLVDDIRVVLAAVGVERTAVCGFQEANFIGAMLAAARPEHVSHLVLIDPSASWTANEELPWEWSVEKWEEVIDGYHDHWGLFTRERLARVERWYTEHGAPDLFDERSLRWSARMERATMAPGAMVAETRKFMATDIRSVLPTIHVPTLVIRRRGNPVVDPKSIRYVADRVEGSTYVEVDSAPHGDPWTRGWEALIEEIEEFIAGTRGGPQLDRALKTVLFTDIVRSSATLSELGDAAWHELLLRHHRIVRDELVRFGGHEEDTAGDGFFATFDGPGRAVRCAQAIVRTVGSLGVEVRAGLHTGEVETIDGKAGGIAVVIGARIGGLAGASEVLVSRTVRDLTAGSGIPFDDAGEHELKGVPDGWQLYRVGR